MTEAALPAPVAAPAVDRERLAADWIRAAVLPHHRRRVRPAAGAAARRQHRRCQWLTFAHYKRLLGPPYYLGVVWNSLRLGLLTHADRLPDQLPRRLCAGAGPAGLALGAAGRTLFLPLAASVIVKAFAWTILLRSDGIVNETLIALGIIEDPIRMIFTETALIVGAVNIFLPFMILPIYAIVAQLDSRYAEAAATLGASPLVTFFRVILPLTLPGIIAGVALVFSLSVSAYVVPTLLIGERYPDARDHDRKGLSAGARTRLRRGGRRRAAGDRHRRGRLERTAVTGAEVMTRAAIVVCWVMAIALALFLIAPLLVIAAASFSPTPVFDLPLTGASTRW